ncbi:hypothetical protein AB0230_01860 [Microbacterium sp. NPDC089190]|uniref:hypothetical protein n=1 Tax=Microbacterium sp. NPDC089190 TaxID=3155063 RepID=UPI0034501813
MSDAPETATVDESINPTVEPAAEAPKPTETVDFWKQKAREQEARAKSNAEAAKRLQEFEDAQKTESQRLADAAAAAKREADEARAEAVRYRVAATHGVGEDYFDLLGSGDEEKVTARAERLAPLLAAASELAQVKAELESLRAGKPAPSQIRPVTALKPGATPDGNASEGDLIYSSLFGAN